MSQDNPGMSEMFVGIMKQSDCLKSLINRDVAKSEKGLETFGGMFKTLE